MKSAAQMAALFPDQLDAIRNSRRIAEMTDIQLPLGTLRIPHFPVPDGHTVETWLREECQRGLERRYGTVTPGAPAAARLRARRDHLDGLSGLLPHRRGLHPVRPRAGHPDDLPRQRPGLDRDLHARHHAGRPDPVPAPVRAVPQPGPRDDAGHRRRLRGRPARRGHRLRRAQVRPGPRRPDHHVRHDARPRRDPRRRPRPRPHATARSTGSPRPSRTSSASSSTRRSRSRRRCASRSRATRASSGSSTSPGTSRASPGTPRPTPPASSSAASR